MILSPAMRRHAIYIAPANTVYTFIPKNACTTLRYAAVMANIGNGYQKHESGSLPDFEAVLAQIENYVASRKQIESASYKFIVLRCPWSRLASVFLDKVVGGKRGGRLIRLNAEAHRHSLPIAFGLRALHRFGFIPYIDPARFSFRQFVDLIAAPGGLMIDHHWTPQAQLALDAYDDVFGMHDLKAAFSKITEKTGMEIHDTRDLSGHSTHRLKLLNDKCYADVPIAELKALKKAGYAPYPAAFYDDALRKSVEKLYEEDLKFYTNHLGSKGLSFAV